jgi:hypothetical protein
MADSGSDGTRKRGGRAAFAPQVAGAGAARLEVEVGMDVDVGRGTGLDEGVASPVPAGAPYAPGPTPSAAAPGPAKDDVDDEAPPNDDEARKLLVRRQKVAESRAKLEAGMALTAQRHADRVSSTKTTSFDRLRKSKSGRALNAPAPADGSALAAAPAGPPHVPLGAGVSLSGEPLDYDAAWAHNLETSPSEVLEDGRRRKFSPFATTTGRLMRDFDIFHEGYQSDFVHFGAGVTAFFKVRKFFYVMWAILAAFAAPSIYVNWFALGNIERQPASPVSLTTLRGFYVQSANAGAPFKLPSGMNVKPSDALVAYAALDCIGAILLLAGFLWASYEIPKEGSRLHAGGATTVAGYSVFVQHLPTRATEDDIVRWVDGIAVAEKLLSGQGVGFALPVLRPDAEPLVTVALAGAGAAAAKTTKTAKTADLARQASSPSKWGSRRAHAQADDEVGADEVTVAIVDAGSAEAASKAGKDGRADKKAGKSGKSAPSTNKAAAAAANEPPPPPPPPGLWPIVDVNIVSDNHEILGLLYQRAGVLRRLDRVNEFLRARNRRTISCVDEALGCFSRGELADERAKLKRSVRKCDADLMKVRLQNAVGGGASAAFITFESTQDALAFAKLFSADCGQRRVRVARALAAEEAAPETARQARDSLACARALGCVVGQPAPALKAPVGASHRVNAREPAACALFLRHHVWRGRRRCRLQAAPAAGGLRRAQRLGLCADVPDLPHLAGRAAAAERHEHRHLHGGAHLLRVRHSALADLRPRGGAVVAVAQRLRGASLLTLAGPRLRVPPWAARL